VAGNGRWSAIKNGHEWTWLMPAAVFPRKASDRPDCVEKHRSVVLIPPLPSILNDISVVEAMVAANPSLHVLMVGRHVSSLPKETLAMSPSLEAVAIRGYDTPGAMAGAKACGADLST